MAARELHLPAREDCCRKTCCAFWIVLNGLFCVVPELLSLPDGDTNKVVVEPSVTVFLLSDAGTSATTGGVVLAQLLMCIQASSEFQTAPLPRPARA